MTLQFQEVARLVVLLHDDLRHNVVGVGRLGREELAVHMPNDTSGLSRYRCRSCVKVKERQRG